MSDGPAIHAVECKVDGCEWVSLRAEMLQLYADMETHLKEEHDYSEQEWAEARQRLQEAGAP